MISSLLLLLIARIDLVNWLRKYCVDRNWLRKYCVELCRSARPIGRLLKTSEDFLSRAT